MTKCKVACAHRAMVSDYHDARHADELRAEQASNGHDSERREWLRRHGITFKAYLQGRAGRGTRRLGQRAA